MTIINNGGKIMEKFLFLVAITLVLMFSVTIYAYGEMKEFQTFASDFEESLAHNGSTKFMNDVYYDQMKKDFVLFKWTDEYKELENEYLLAVKKEQNFFSTVK